MEGNPRKAQKLSREALKLAEKEQNNGAAAESHLNLGWCHNYLAEYESALNHLFKGLSLYQVSANQEGQMKIFNAIGIAYQWLGLHEAALAYHEQGLKIGRRLGSDERQLASLNNMGETHWELGNYKEALSRFRMAGEIAQELGDKEKLAKILVNQGHSYFRLKQEKRALESLTRSLSISRDIKDRISEAKCLVALGQVHLDMNEEETAEECYDKSLAVSRANENPLGEIEALLKLGDLRTRQGREEEALSSYAAVADLSKSIEAQIPRQSALRALAETHERLGSHVEALKYFKEARKSEQAMLHSETEEKLRNLTIQYRIERAQRETELYRIHNKELAKKSQELTESYKRIATMSQIGQRITSRLDLNEVAKILHKSLGKLMDAPMLSIALLNRISKSVDFKVGIESSEGLPEESIPLSSQKSFAVWCIKNREEIVLNDIAREYTAYIKGRTTIGTGKSQSLVFLPLVIGRRVIGALTVQSFQKGAYSDRHVELLRAIASYVAIAAENARIHREVNDLNDYILQEKQSLEDAYHKISHMANHDSLTGLPNRRLLAEFMDRVTPQADRQKDHVALLYMDLDEFKPVNDSLGHEVGDAVLRIIAKRLVGALRAMDIVARVGGDEFVAIIQNAKSPNAVERVADKILRKLTQPVTVKKRTCRLSTSIGISLYPEDGRDLDQLLRKADQALYWVKNRSKGKFAFASDISEKG
jgi:diguanylate cyclase (GGDEF)-like protein